MGKTISADGEGDMGTQRVGLDMVAVRIGSTVDFDAVESQSGVIDRLEQCFLLCTKCAVFIGAFDGIDKNCFTVRSHGRNNIIVLDGFDGGGCFPFYEENADGAPGFLETGCYVKTDSSIITGSDQNEEGACIVFVHEKGICTGFCGLIAECIH